MRKKALFLIFILSLAFSICSARDLEIDYPKIGGYQPEEVSTPLPEYVKYIFNFSIWAIGILAFGIIVFAGIRYLTSTGDPKVKEEAKKQIKAAFIGGGILLFSYLILTTINPQLVKFETQELKKVEALPLPSPTKSVSLDPLVRIKELAEDIKKRVLPLIKEESSNIEEAVKICKCSNCLSECDCIGLICTPIRCYGDPCRNRDFIEEKQKSIIITMDGLLHYKNRIISEKEDISPELEHFIYWERLTEESCNSLLKNMENLVEQIKEISLSVNKLAELPNECIISGNECKATCKEKSCHDTYGCHPKECSGGNPCPTDEINAKINEINDLSGNISLICEQIINILK